MAWFNRKTVTWTEQELKWIEENAPQEKTADSQEEKRGGAIMAKWFNADVLVNQKYRIAIRNLPEEIADEPALIRMLTARGMKNCDVTSVQKEVDDSNSSMLPHHSIKNKKAKMSYKLSFKSEVEMINAI